MDSLLSDMVRIANLQFKTGEGTLLQKTSAEARHSDLQNLINQNSADQKIYSNQLGILLNTSENIEVANGSLVAFTTTLPNDSIEINKNPSLLFYQSLATVAAQEKKAEFNKVLPDLSIGFFSQTLIGYQQYTDGSTPYFNSSNRFTGITAGIAIPLWFLPHNARIKSAEVRSQSASLNASYFQKQLTGQWTRATQEFRKNRNSLDYYTKSALPNADLIFRQSSLAYKTGEITQAELRLNLQQALSIEEGYLQSLLQYNLSIITLEFLSGQSLKN